MNEGWDVGRILLVVEDEESIAALYQRHLKRHFDAIFAVADESEAEGILEREAVTHLVSDYNLGPNHPVGATLISRWRDRWPAIRYAAILSASELDTLRNEAVDEIFLKPAGFEQLIERLAKIE